MARVRTAENLVADVRKRVNLEHSELLDDNEIIEYLNQEFSELKMAMRLAEGQPHDVNVAPPIVVTPGTSLYDLPADFWQILGVTANIGGLNRRLEPFMENERASLQNSILIGTQASPMYRIANRTQIEFLPPTLSFSATLRYVPAAVRLVLGQIPEQTIDGFNGYEMAAVYGTCASLREKEETDPSFFEGRKLRIYTLIQATTAQRDAGAPERVTDVTGGLDYDILSPFGFR